MPEPADTIREALTILYDHSHHDNGPALAALTELEQDRDHWREFAAGQVRRAEAAEADANTQHANMKHWKQEAKAAEADRDRLQRENKRLTNDLDDLQRANDKMRRENQKLRRGDVLADRDRLADTLRAVYDSDTHEEAMIIARVALDRETE